MFSKLSPEKILYMDNVMKSGQTVKVNRDFQPVYYYYDMIFWASHFRNSVFKQVLKYVDEQKIWKIVFVLFCLIVLSAIRQKHKRYPRARVVMTAIMVTGFAEIIFQIVILPS